MLMSKLSLRISPFSIKIIEDKKKVAALFSQRRARGRDFRDIDNFGGAGLG